MIEKLRLKDIQSYKDVTFDFSSGVNVLEAPNETGKSIMFKVFRLMCDSNWYGRNGRKSIVRRGCGVGIAMFSVIHENERIGIVFEIYMTRQVYKLCDSSGNVMKAWEQNECPQAILDILGWYYDKDSKILLNLCDQELDMPFVNSNLRFNYEAVRFIIVDEELETARDNLQQWVNETKETVDYLNLQSARIEDLMNTYKAVDVASLQRSIDKRKVANENAKALCDTYEVLSNIVSLEQPKFNKADQMKIDTALDSIFMLQEVGHLLQDVIRTKKPVFEECDTYKIESIIEASKQLNQIKFILSNTLKDLDNLKTCKMKLQNEKELIEVFEQENKFCPLCGCSFGEEHNHE